jgi:hypothetical protein
LVLGHQPSFGFEQGYEDVKGSGPQVYRDAVSEQLPLAQEDTKTPEFDRVGCWPTRRVSVTG